MQSKESRYLNNQSKFISKYRKRQQWAVYKWRPLSGRDALNNRAGQPLSGQAVTTPGVLSRTISSQHDTYASDPPNAFVAAYIYEPNGMQCNMALSVCRFIFFADVISRTHGQDWMHGLFDWSSMVRR